MLTFIKQFLQFESKDDFYLLQVLQRRKDNPEMKRGLNILKVYYITSFKALEACYDEVKLLCDTFNARSVIRLNKRSFEKVALKTLVNLSNQLTNKDYSAVKHTHYKACIQSSHVKNKKWIVDIDSDDINNGNSIYAIKTFINGIKPDVIIAECPSKTGHHLITKPFNRDIFFTKYPKIAILTDSFINIYYKGMEL